MNKHLILTAMAAAAMGLTLGACHHGEEHDHDHEGHDHEAEMAEHKEHDHEHHIEFSAENEKRFGLEIIEVQPSDFSEVLKVSGQIVSSPDDEAVVSARTSGIVTIAPGVTEGKRLGAGARVATVQAKGVTGGDSNEAARAELAAAKREVERLKPLHAEGIVTTRDYNEAVLRMEAAQAAYSSGASGAATTPIAGTLTKLLVKTGEFVNAGQPIAYVSKNSRLTLRADVPERYHSFLTHVKSANFKPSYSDEVMAVEGAQRTASAASAQNGYIPVYFTFTNKGGALNGAYADVYLQGESRQGVITVPVEALIEQQGNFYVYVKEHEGAFEKQRVTTGMNDGVRIEILSGLEPGMKVVGHGAGVIRMTEAAGSIPAHSHHH